MRREYNVFDVGLRDKDKGLESKSMCGAVAYDHQSYRSDKGSQYEVHDMVNKIDKK